MKTKLLILTLAIICVFGFTKFQMTGNITGETTKDSGITKVLMQTNLGDIEIELYSDKAPTTVKNFLGYVNDGTYEGTVFHRVIADFMIQGGGFLPDGTEKPTKAPIKLESDNGLKNTKGTIAMARTMVEDSATNQFFINTKDNEFLNYASGNPGYAVFGKVTKGLDIVEKIESQQTTTKNNMQDWPIEDIIIKSVKVIE